MREHKVRGWDGKKMLPAQDLTQCSKHWEWLGKVDVELIHYIGLKDKNGKEIYECDLILYDDGRLAKVVWHDYLARFDSIGITDKGIARPITDRPEILAEVIGNIYENPELLDG